jgi:hypothetical protein
LGCCPVTDAASHRSNRVEERWQMWWS